MTITSGTSVPLLDTSLPWLVVSRGSAPSTWTFWTTTLIVVLLTNWSIDR
jgi:hypothetical protein